MLVTVEVDTIGVAAMDVIGRTDKVGPAAVGGSAVVGGHRMGFFAAIGEHVGQKVKLGQRWWADEEGLRRPAIRPEGFRQDNVE